MAEDLQPDDPRHLGRYRLLSRLGRGGMGTVYLGEDENGRQVAIKVINQDLAEDPDFAERFRNEVVAARRVRRFCTAPVLDAALDRPPWYLVTEYIDGPTLEETVERNGPLRGSALEGLAVGMATALSAIHDAGLVHRDLKPGNVLLSPYGPRVIDFGIARALDARTAITRTGQIVGTPAYLAPELVMGGDVTPAADVFSWGCVVAFAGTGRGPFAGRTLPEILHRVAYEPPDLGGLEPALVGVVAAALAKDPYARPSVSALLTQLAGHRPEGPWQPATLPISRPSRPRRTGALVGGLLGVAALVAAVIVIVTLKSSSSASGPSAGGSQATRTTPTPTPPPTPPAGEVPSGLLGNWHGSVDQEGSVNSPYPVTITLVQGRVGAVVGHSSYSTLRCGGELTLTTASADRLVVEEHITEGRENCIDGVAITLKRAGGRLDYSFENPTGHGLLSH
jgi:serine/threonine protein kinase